MYSNSAHRATQTDNPHSNRAPWLADVAYLRSTPDEMVAVSVPTDGQSITSIRFTYRNKNSVTVTRDALRWLLTHECKGVQGDPIPALAAKIARALFRSCGGKKRLGVSFENWMTCHA